MEHKPTVVVWFRRDLRIGDNPALSAATEFALTDPEVRIIPLYIASPVTQWEPGAASRWWLHHSLISLNNQFQALGGQLWIRAGDALASLLELVQLTNAKAVFWNRMYDPESIVRDRMVKEALHTNGILAKSYNGSLLHEPWQALKADGSPYRVFTPFYRAIEKQSVMAPVSNPATARFLVKDNAVDAIDRLMLLPKRNWDVGFYQRWSPGCEGARLALDRVGTPPFIVEYGTARDIPSVVGTSSISPYLHFGEISVRSAWHAVINSGVDSVAATPYLRELAWREFAYHLLYHFPNMPNEPLQEKFKSFPWEPNDGHLQAWQSGSTGYPIVDAGMRELWHTGWMHNRVRMIVSSFLTKHLLQSWQSGARWFWNTLVDADLASNSMGWQWVAGCGVDAAPYFRIFNPVTQGEKFDANGVYVRRWVPEIAKLPNKFIHQPWVASEDILCGAGVKLGFNYPKPVIDHTVARQRALAALGTITKIK